MRLLAPLLLALLLVPLAEGHIQGARPVYQRAQSDRLVGIDPDGLEMRYTLSIEADPLRHTVRHEAEPSLGRFFVEHREDGSRVEDRYQAQWELERIIEYRDQNLDGRWSASSDTAVRAWRPTHYQWRIGGLQTVQVSDVQAQSAVWTANLTGAPSLRMEIVAAGKAFSDEGALVRPQDLAIYFDVKELPQRDLGSLYAVEWRVRVDDSTILRIFVAEETPTALLADNVRRRAMLLWGGEALIDGSERLLHATLEDERVDEYGNRTALLVMHLPVAEREMHFMLVSALEYGVEVVRGTPAWPWAAVVALALAARTHTGSRGSR